MTTPDETKARIQENIERVKAAMLKHGIDPEEFPQVYLYQLAKVLLWEEKKP